MRKLLRSIAKENMRAAGKKHIFKPRYGYRPSILPNTPPVMVRLPSEFAATWRSFIN
jgi:hypothetical protein